MSKSPAWEKPSGATVTKRPYYATSIYPTYMAKISTAVYNLETEETNPLDIQPTIIKENPYD